MKYLKNKNEKYLDKFRIQGKMDKSKNVYNVRIIKLWQSDTMSLYL